MVVVSCPFEKSRGRIAWKVAAAKPLLTASGVVSTTKHAWDSPSEWLQIPPESLDAAPAFVGEGPRDHKPPRRDSGLRGVARYNHNIIFNIMYYNIIKLI